MSAHLLSVDCSPVQVYTLYCFVFFIKVYQPKNVIYCSLLVFIIWWQHSFSFIISVFGYQYLLTVL